MKKIFLIFFIGIVLLCGCEKQETLKEGSKEEEKKEEIIESLPEYHDDNQTPISFYQLKGNKLEKIHTISGNFNGLDDIGLFQIYPSNEESISLNTNFGTSFYDAWQNYASIHSIRLGFSLTIPVEGEESISYPIFSPSQTMDHWEYIMSYLYDDYANRGKSFYSHIEIADYTDATLFTAIKLQCGAYCPNISSPILFTVFTYDGEDDFLDGSYRGNSKHTISLCIHGDC